MNGIDPPSPGAGFAPGPAVVAGPQPRVPQRRPGDRQAVFSVLVAVGTDKHPFDRLVRWLEQWHAEAGSVALTIQHGHTRAPAVPGAVAFLGHADLQAMMARAQLVVCHGGPATILEARRHGHLPIVVPRDPAFGEHVDNHQLLFARRLGSAGLVVLCESREALLAALSLGQREPQRFVVAADEQARQAQRAAVARVGRIVEELVAASPRRGWRPWRWRRTQARPDGEQR